MKTQLKLVDANTKLDTIKLDTNPSTIQLQKGVFIRKREIGSNWQVRICVKGKKDVRLSTGTTDVEEAKKVCLTKLAEINYRIANNYTIHKKSFDEVAKDFLKDAKKMVDNNALKPTTCKFYEQTITNYLLPYFANLQKMQIENVNRVTISQFQKWRIENGKSFADGNKCKPSSATLNKEEGVLSKILDFAVDAGYIDIKAPIKKTKVKSKRHPAFTKVEFRQLMRKLRLFIEASPNSNIKSSRVAMYSAVVILAKTGLRPHELLPDTDKATKGLKWANVEFDTDVKSGKKYVKLQITKTVDKNGKGRDVYSGASAYWHLLRMREKLSDRWVAIEKIFVSDFRRTFGTFLTWANMRTNAEGEKFCMYSFRHSFATWKIEEGVSIQQLAEVMGNSPNIIHKHYSHAMTGNFKENFI